MTISDSDVGTKEALRKTLRHLSALHGISGFEQAVVRYMRRRLEEVVSDVQTDRYENVTATKKGKAGGPLLMISAHMDEIAFVVKGIEPEGFLRFDRIGGSGEAVLPCRKLDVAGHLGLIGSISGHLAPAARLGQITPLTDLYIDVGASSAAEVAEMAALIHMSREGVPAITVGVPRRYSYSPHETIDLSRCRCRGPSNCAICA